MNNRFKYILMGIFAVLIWAAIPAFVKIGSDFETLPFLLVLRFLIASLFFVYLIPRLISKASQVKTWLWLLLFVSLGANFYFQGLAMINLPVSWYLIIFCLNPLFALLLIGIKFDKQLVLGLILSILGTVLFVNLNEVQQIYGWLPFLYLAIGMITWVAYTVLIKKFQLVYSNIEVTGLTQILALISCLFIWGSTGFKAYSINNVILPILALGLLTPLAYFGFTSCLKQMPRFSIVAQYLEPVFGIVIGVVFFREELSNLQLLGSAMIVVGAIWVEK